ncbi:uncharacterized protein LOC131954369 [Physella acuta]|uniref:uncharacterized protein LOC131954369 n=1 Tax=Physella acuta TaxID=109671 RepID=UPI0027DE4EA9|nr:uncharacterized protein LOC131954369 [Physella acuta]
MLYPLLAITNSIFMIGQFVINGLSASGPDGTVFQNRTGDISAKFETPITPAGWTFSIWGFIYAWQTLWVIYSLVNICRKSGSGPLYENPRFLPLSMLGVCIIICCVNIAWLISFDRQEIEAACGLLIAYGFLMYGAMYISYKALDKASAQLVEQKRTVDIWLTRALVHNGLGIQATWVTIATLLNVSMVMIYSGNQSVDHQTSGTIVLAILSAELSIYAIADFFFLDRYSRYTITPYMVVVVALIGSINKHYEDGEQNSIFKIVLLAVAGALLVLKIAVTIFKHFRRPRYVSHYESTISEKPIAGQYA